MERARPPAAILPSDFFLHWVPEIVAQDTERQQKLGDTRATVVFHLTGAGGGSYTVRIESGRVEGREGAAEDPDLPELHPERVMFANPSHSAPCPSASRPTGAC